MVRFITFEGGDGTGKTTQVQSVERHLRGLGRPCISTREPGGTGLGKMIRQILLEAGENEIAASTELFLYLADRSQHVAQVIAPALRAGKVVLCDRFTDSTLAYQGYGRGIDLDWLRRLNDTASANLHPDLTFLFDCPVSIGLDRAGRRSEHSGSGRPHEDRFERENHEFHERVRNGFLQLASFEPERFRIIDASRSVAAVEMQIREIIERENI